MEPSRSERAVICNANDLVIAIATWVGHCTLCANKFPIECQGKRTFIRDSSAAKANRVRPRFKSDVSSVAVKRKVQKHSGTSSIVKVPRFSHNSACSTERLDATVRNVLGFFSVPHPNKRRRLTDSKADERNDFVFMEYWAENRRRELPRAPPLVSAAARRKALLDRISAKSAR